MSQDDQSEAVLSLERMLGLRMHSFSNMVQANFYQRTEKPIGISLPEWRVLRATILEPGVSQGKIAAAEGLNAMIVSRAVAGLQRKGLLEARPDPSDRRRSRLEPTDLGMDLGRDLAEREQVMYSHVFSVLSQEHRQSLDDLLNRVIDHVRANQPPAVPAPSQPWKEIIAANMAAYDDGSDSSD